jgi:hypothetical protein
MDLQNNSFNLLWFARTLWGSVDMPCVCWKEHTAVLDWEKFCALSSTLPGTNCSWYFVQIIQSLIEIEDLNYF